MLALLTSKWRSRAAALLVALYALCVVAPVAAFAASDGAMPAHCLTDDDHAMAATGESHDHHDGAGHQHPGPTHDDHDSLAKCCGLFGVTAIAPAFETVATPMVQASDVAMPAAESLSGRSAGRIDRPPRSLLSL
jgi:hypothetical protein